MSSRRLKKNPLSFQTQRNKEVILQEITKEEILDGYTIASALNFKSLGLSASVCESGGEQFGPVKDLSPLGDMVTRITFCILLDVWFYAHLDFVICRMAPWTFLLIMLMGIVCNSLYLQNLVLTNLSQQR